MRRSYAKTVFSLLDIVFCRDVCIQYIPIAGAPRGFRNQSQLAGVPVKRSSQWDYHGTKLQL